jgi:hypothetical protein
MRSLTRLERSLFATLSAATLLAASAGDAFAERWIPIGARQRGEGGAGVAATEDATSIYWNPANLSFLPLNRPPYPSASRDKIDRAADDATEGVSPRKTTPDDAKVKDENLAPEEDSGRWTGYESHQVELAVNAELYLTGDIVRRVNDLDQLIKKSDIQGASQRASQTPPALTLQDFRNLVSFYDQIQGLNQGGDGIGELGGGLFARYKWFGLGIYSNTYSEIRPHVDLSTNAGFSDSATANQIGNGLVANGADTSNPPPGSGQEQLRNALVNQAGLTPTNANAIANLAAQSGADLNNPDLRDALRIAAQQSGVSGGSILNNTSGALVKSLSTQELAVTLAIPLSSEIGLPLDPDVLGIGIVPKLMSGVTAEEDVRIVDALNGSLSFGDVSKKFFNNRKQSLTFGLDAGATVQPTSWLRVGVTGRNLNDPKFKLKDGGDYELRHQVRGGVMIRPAPSLALTCDADLIPNRSDALPGLKSRQVGGGIEWNPDWREFGLAIRAGAYGDLEDPRAGNHTVLTGGVGAKLFGITVNLAGSASLKREKFRDYDVPSDLGLAADLGVTW